MSRALRRRCAWVTMGGSEKLEERLLRAPDL